MTDVGRDRALALSRRLDWRFLFPDPALGRVAYLGDGSGQLRQSLELFAGTVDVLAAADLDARGLAGQFDVVVLQEPASIEARHRGLLKRQGGLYAEFSRASMHPLRKRAISAVAYARAAAAAGFAEVRLNWHWPTFESCTRIVPLDDATPLGFLLSGGDRSLLANFAWTGAALLIRGGALSRSASCFSLIAKAP
jgi:hypothetical protein